MRRVLQNVDARVQVQARMELWRSNRRWNDWYEKIVVTSAVTLVLQALVVTTVVEVEARGVEGCSPAGRLLRWDDFDWMAIRLLHVASA